MKIRARTQQLSEINLNLEKEVMNRIKAEEALAIEKQRLADIIEGTNLGTWEWNIQTGETIFNERWAGIIGYSLAEISPVSIDTWMKFAHPEDLKESGELLEKHFSGESDFYTFESRIRHKNGEWVWVLDRGKVSEWDSHGKPLRMAGTHQDITERKRAEKEILTSKIEAEKANQAKSEFLSRMSHELRTPMNSILGFAQLLNMGELTPKQKQGIGHILSSGKHLLNLINEVLDISRIESGKLALFPEPVQLGDAIAEVIDSVRPMAEDRQIKIVLENSPANKCTIVADRKRLKQILINLLNNAVKYNRQGGAITVKTEVKQQIGDEDSVVRISVTDTGMGILPEDISRLFIPFERIGAEKIQTEGAGLGLAIVKKITGAMGGSVSVESTAGEGSTFRVDLPVSCNTADSKVSEENTTQMVERQNVVIREEIAGTPRTATILYIEDNFHNADLVKEIIETYRPGTHLAISRFGNSALEMARKYQPDLILLDLDLPDIKGQVVLARILADDLTKTIPVVIVTADATLKQIELLRTAGARDYLTKPLDVALFLKVVDEWIGQSESVKYI